MKKISKKINDTKKSYMKKSKKYKNSKKQVKGTFRERKLKTKKNKIGRYYNKLLGAGNPVLTEAEQFEASYPNHLIHKPDYASDDERYQKIWGRNNNNVKKRDSSSSEQYQLTNVSNLSRLLDEFNSFFLQSFNDQGSLYSNRPISIPVVLNILLPIYSYFLEWFQKIKDTKDNHMKELRDNLYQLDFFDILKKMFLNEQKLFFLITNIFKTQMPLFISHFDRYADEICHKLFGVRLTCEQSSVGNNYSIEDYLDENSSIEEKFYQELISIQLIKDILADVSTSKKKLFQFKEIKEFDEFSSFLLQLETFFRDYSDMCASLITLYYWCKQLIDIFAAVDYSNLTPGEKIRNEFFIVIAKEKEKESRYAVALVKLKDKSTFYGLESIFQNKLDCVNKFQDNWKTINGKFQQILTDLPMHITNMKSMFSQQQYLIVIKTLLFKIFWKNFSLQQLEGLYSNFFKILFDKQTGINNKDDSLSIMTLLNEIGLFYNKNRIDNNRIEEEDHEILHETLLTLFEYSLTPKDKSEKEKNKEIVDTFIRTLECFMLKKQIKRERIHKRRVREAEIPMCLKILKDAVYGKLFDNFADQQKSKLNKGEVIKRDIINTSLVIIRESESEDSDLLLASLKKIYKLIGGKRTLDDNTYKLYHDLIKSLAELQVNVSKKKEDQARQIYIEKKINELRIKAGCLVEYINFGMSVINIHETCNEIIPSLLAPQTEV